MRIEPVVSSSGLVNAFALPGMMVVNFGLIEESGSPDELIGVMAHEAGHLEHAHFGRGIAGRMLLSGLSTSLGVFSGLLPAAVNNQFTSELETDADAVAIQKLDALGISRKPMVDFFVRQKAKHSDNQVSIAAETLLSTHPLTESRILHFLKDPPSAGIISPAIRERLERDRLHWKEIKTHCLNFETLKEGQ
jgi:predicted Zn-dependent protease